MTRKSSDSPGTVDKDALIARLLVQIADLTERLEKLAAENTALRTRVTELEDKLGQPPKTPDNSSTPPSKGQKPSDETASKPKRKAHPGAHRPLHPNPTKRLDLKASQCQHCGADVSERTQLACETYDHIEIPPIEPEVTRVTLHGGVCPCCAKKFKAAPPDGMAPGSPFGSNLRALAIYLRFNHAISFERLACLFSDLLGLEISEGALVNILDAAQKPFAAQRSLIREKLLSGTALCSDETGLRVGKTNWWFWVFHHDDSAVFVAKDSRAKSVVAEFLQDYRPDFWVSDRYAGQLGWAQKDNQLCLAHLIRDAQYAIDAGDQIFAPTFQHLLGHACDIGRRRSELKETTLKSYAGQLEKKLDTLMKLTPTNSAGKKLQQAIKGIRRYLFVFVTNPGIPPTNNGSERALRPAAVFRKVTNGFRTGWGAELYADIRSVIETGRRRGIGALKAIRLTLAGQPLQPVL